ncbi:MAG: TRL domain-containing protein [Planctomycetota bacterium]
MSPSPSPAAVKLLGLLLCLPLGGCISGAIYQHTIEPLDVNYTNTPTGSKVGTSDRKGIEFNYLRLAWDGDDIAGTAKKAGMTEVHYADREVLSILGIWRQDYVHVYGR